MRTFLVKFEESNDYVKIYIVAALDENNARILVRDENSYFNRVKNRNEYPEMVNIKAEDLKLSNQLREEKIVKKII